MAQRNIVARTIKRIIEVPLMANMVVEPGEIVIRTDATGFCRNTAAASCTGVGVATEAKDNTGGADGAKTVSVAQGEFLVDNHGTDTCVAKDVGGLCYFKDANTVGNVAAGASPVGEVLNLGYTGETGVLVNIES